MRRPLAVTLLAILVLSLTAWNGVRCYAALASWALLDELAASPGPLYIALTGFTWAAAGLVLFLGLWTGRRWAPKFCWAYVPLYIVYFWADRVLFRPAERTQNFAFVLALQIAALGLTAFALVGPRGESFFVRRSL
jgi:hypothetical protein